jgi:Arc/MetJ-type ribon-helix-helix transcriptional regulator
MEMYTAPPGEAWRLGEGPFIFAGRPPLLTGELEIQNLTQEKLRVRGIRATGGDDPDSQQAYGMDVVRTAVRLLPQQRARVTGQVVVEQSTPPGTYRTQLTCGEQREEAVIHVFANEIVDVQPRPLAIAAPAGDPVSPVVIATNHGNVVQPIPAVVLVFLEEFYWVNRSLVFALRETTDQEGHQAYLDRALREIQGSLLSPVRVTITADRQELRPGETVQTSIKLRLPTEMARGRVYIGSVPFIGGTLEFKITCTERSRTRRRRAAG